MDGLELERNSLKEIENYQFRKLKELLIYVSNNSRFYNDLFRSKNIDINEINTLSDISKLPLASKNDLQERNNDFICVTPSEIAEYTCTSGTSGAPVTIAQTKNDLERLAFNEFLSFICVGTGKNDVFQLALTLDKQFMAGMAYYLGASRLGAPVVRTGPGAPSMQWETIFRLNTTTLVIVPSFILKLIEFAEENNIDLRKTPVKRAICIGENIRNENLELNIIGQRVREKWDIQLFSTYASSEMQTAFTECVCGNGGHLHADLLIAEILDDDLNPVKEGEFGELTITTLGVEGMPLLRYRTGDICRLIYEPCPCGRTTPRISPIVGRKQQMIKFKGTSLYPPAIFEILNAQKGISDYVVEVCTNELNTDEVVLYIASADQSDKLAQNLKSYLHASLRVRPRIVFSELEYIQKMQQEQGLGRKLSKFFDNRKSFKP